MTNLKARAQTIAKKKTKKRKYEINLMSILITLRINNITQKNQSAFVLTNENTLIKLRERLKSQ